MLSQKMNRFTNKFQDTTIQKYFGINMKIDFTVNGNEITLVVRAKKIYPCYDFLELPKDINRLIASYNVDSLAITVKITFGERYPFYQPTWELIDIDSNICTHIDLKDYYGYLVENHNKTNEDWSPIVSIEADILGFVQKINHFEYL
jgi:hypothetical protein